MADPMPKKNKVPSTQQFLPIEEIKEGVVTMKNGSLRAVIMVSTVNFQLKSEGEKDAMIAGYQSFLNSLVYPIQIMSQSRKTQLDSYLERLRSFSNTQENTLLRAQIEQYIEFVGGLVEEANIMAKRFFVIVPFYPTGIKQVGEKNLIKNIFKNKPQATADFETQKMELMQRVEQVIGGLSGVGLRCIVLNTEDLIELYYSVYNPDLASSEKLANTSELEAPIITSGEEQDTNV